MAMNVPNVPPAETTDLPTSERSSRPRAPCLNRFEERFARKELDDDIPKASEATEDNAHHHTHGEAHCKTNFDSIKTTWFVHLTTT